MESVTCAAAAGVRRGRVLVDLVTLLTQTKCHCSSGPCRGCLSAHQLLEGGEGLEAEVAEEGELVGVAEVGQQQLGRGGGAGALGTLQHLSLMQHLTLLQHRYCSHLVTAVVSSRTYY